MLKLDMSRQALAGIFALSMVLVAGVLSTQARNGRQDAAGMFDISRPVQIAPPPVGTYPQPVPSFPPPIPSHQYPRNTPTAKPTREPRPTATPHPWLRYVELLPGGQR